MIDQAVEDALEAYKNPNGTEAPKEYEGYCSLNTDQFPCSENIITLVSLGLAASGMGLIMVFFLLHRVRTLKEERHSHPS